MICALDSYKAANSRQEELKRIEEEKRIKKERILLKNSIEYCEDVIALMIKNASNKGNYNITLEFAYDYLLGGYAQGLVESHQYANKKIAYKPNPNCPALSIDFIRAYLEKHCYTIEERSRSYQFNSYDTKPYTEMTISWKKVPCENKAN